MSDQASSAVCDVTVIGSGLAGRAAAVHLAKAGLKVICIDPPEAVRPPVGESLDWSAPELLKQLGLPMEDLIKRQLATWKNHVTVKLRDGCSAHYVPTPWLAGKPFHIELQTLHIERPRIDEEIQRIATNLGVTRVAEKVIGIEQQGRKISSVLTSTGKRFSSPWFVDASGSATCLLAREFNLPAVQYGPTKVAIWTYFPVSESVEGTTLYMDPKPTEYLDWIWEIPVQPQVVSVGFITTGTAMKAKREQGFAVDDIFWEQLMRFPRFESLVQGGALGKPSVTSFKCRAHAKVAGPNWLIAGEAAAMVDPMTSNGVTAALRQATEASQLILKYRKRGTLPLRARACYASRILQMAKFFNSGIEKLIYEARVRNRISLQSSGTAYTSPAWSMNVVYARLKPNGILSTLFLNSLLLFFRASAWIFYHLCKRPSYAAGMPT